MSTCSGKSSQGSAALQVTGPLALSVAFVGTVNGPPVYVIEVLLSEIVPFDGVVARLTSVSRAAKVQRRNVAKMRGLRICPFFGQVQN